MAFSSFGSDSKSMQPMAEINTTPLVDVMLVLLVIFIITAPLFHQAVPIDLPRVDSTRLDEKPQVIQVAIDAGGIVYVNGAAASPEVLMTRMREAVSTGGPAPELHLRADRGARYERVAEVMAAAQKIGITRIAFVTERLS
jgi:biopolymer transport protein ExbD